MSLIEDKGKEFLIYDSVCQSNDDVDVDRRWLTTEFLNDIKCFSMPNHRLHIKKGVPIMLLRNIDVSAGLCNGTRLIVVDVGKNIIGGTIIYGPHVGEKAYTPRMNLIPSDSASSLIFQRRQFPLHLCL